MKIEDFEFIENTLRELSLFLHEKKLEESWQKRLDEKAQFKRLFYIVGSESDKTNNVSTQRSEVEKMDISIKGVSVCKKPRADGRYQGYYCDGKQKQYVYGRTPQEVEEKLKILVKKGIKKKNKSPYNVPTEFVAFTEYYFNTFRKRLVTSETFRADQNRFNNYIKPKFKNRSIRTISPKELQDIMDNIVNSGKGKTADEVFSLLSIIFKAAIKHGVVSRNPLDVIFHRQHETVNGKALSIDDIKDFIERASSEEYFPIYMIALYTGLRPNEYEKFTMDDKFITAVNSKRKNGKVEYKKIPIMRELRQYLTAEIQLPSYEVLRKKFKALMPEFTLKDLRRTFNSRCIECGINDTVRKIWMGHSLGKLGKAYTELSDDFILKEAEKFYYFSQF
ncbi:MAG: hypothetical protein SPL13_02075 [Clostridia bacterium]|nr:hypothetical protein [Clostridia bacterium]